MTLEKFFYDIYVPMRLIGASPRTIANYRLCISKLRDFLGRDPEVSDLNDETIARHLHHLFTTATPGTVAKERAQLLALSNLAARKRLLPEFVEVKSIRVPQRLPAAWDKNQLTALIAACRKRVGVIGGVSAAGWFTSLHLCIFDTGERIGALLEAQFSDLRGDCLLVRAEHRKGRTRDRLYPLANDTLEWIRRVRLPQRDHIWPMDCSISTIYRQYDQILMAAGLETGRDCKFHRMRKTVATWLAAQGIDPQTQLDHANPATTRRYIDPKLIPVQAPRDVLDRIVDRTDY